MAPSTPIRQRLAARIGSLSIRTKIALGVLLLLFGFGGIVSLGVRSRIAAAMWEGHREMAILTARDLEAYIDLGMQRDSPMVLRGHLRRRAAIDPNIAYVLVSDRTGAIVASTFNDDCPPQIASANAVAANEPFHVSVVDFLGIPVWDVAVPITGGGGGAVRVGILQLRTQRAIEGITRFVLQITIAVAALGALGAFLLTSLIVNPVLRLAKASEAIRAGDLQQRVSAQGGDEVARLAAAFNAMADTLARSQGEIQKVNQQLVRRNTGLSVLNAVSQAVGQSLDLNAILNSALDAVRTVLDVKVGWILLKADDGRLKLAASKGFSEASPPDEIEHRPEDCACRQTVDGGQTRVVLGSPNCLHGGLDLLQRERLDCHASIPLRAKENILGVMNLAYPADRHFAEDDIQLLNSAGHQIGMAIENARLYEDLRRKEAQLISAHEDERTRIARELHDEAGQSLTALLLQLGEVENMLPPMGAVSSLRTAETACPPVLQGTDLARQRLTQLQAMTAGIITEIRRLMTDLRPSLLDDLGLIPAVRSFAEGQLGSAGVRVRVEVQGGSRRLAPSIEIALFRIFQEAITNVKKHARAAHCTIAMVFKELSVSASVVDDGRGFDPIASRGVWQAFGLVGMEERVALLKGRLQIDSQEQQGTRITLEIPAPSA